MERQNSKRRKLATSTPAAIFVDNVIVLDDDTDPVQTSSLPTSTKWVPCPICGKEFLSTNVEQHVNHHFEENPNENGASSQQGLLDPSTSQVCPVIHCKQLINIWEWNDHAAIHSQELAVALSKEEIQLPQQSNHRLQGKGQAANQGTPTNSKAIQYERDTTSQTHGLMGMLRQACNNQLQKHSKTPTSILMTGPVDHYTQSHDRRWGCGYRNIQILVSHLMKFDQYKQQLFNGCGFTPTVAGLQMGIEAAWQDGFDRISALQLGHKLLHTHKWIGTSECCALLRYHGIRAHIVSFCSKSGNTHQHLIDWVWKYFSPLEDAQIKAGGTVIVKDKTPIYFQHQGHSRTIVGIEKRLEKGALKYFLLILDPIQPGKKYINGFMNNKWAGLVKRSVGTLRMNEYELLYVDGVMTAAEQEASKILQAKETYGKVQTSRQHKRSEP